MDYLYLLFGVLSYVTAWRTPRNIYIESKKDCKARDFVPRAKTYYFRAHHSLECEIPISIPSIYGQYQYCVNVENAIIHGNCPIELRIYEGLTSYGKSPKVTLTCDSTSITSPFCVSGAGNGIFILYKVFAPSSTSEISLDITYGHIPRTTTVFTPNNYDDDNYSSNENISTLVPLLAIVAVMILVCLCVYYCCCKMSKRGTAIREPDNRQTTFSDPMSREQGQSPPMPSAPAFNEPPPSYANTIPLVTPTAPPMISEDPPPYESVIKNAV